MDVVDVVDVGVATFAVMERGWCSCAWGCSGVLKCSGVMGHAGISTQDQAKLFEPYSFVTSGWVQKAGVSGLGLSMAKRFVERAGGSIGVESEEGSGSTFFFSIPFPLAPVEECNEREQAKADAGGAVLQKSEVTQSTSSSGVTVVHESITLTRRRASMKEESVPSAKAKKAEVPDGRGDSGEVARGGADGYVSKETGRQGSMKKDGGIQVSTRTESGKQESRAGGRERKVLLVEDTRINRVSIGHRRWCDV